MGPVAPQLRGRREQHQSRVGDLYIYPVLYIRYFKSKVLGKKQHKQCT